MIFVLSELIYFFSYIYVCQQLLDSFEKNTKERKTSIVVLCVFWVGMIYAITYFYQYHILVKWMLIMCVNILSLHYYFEMKLKTCFVLSFGYEMLYIACGYITSKVVKTLVPNVNTSKMNESLIGLFAVVFCQTLLSLLCFWIIEKRNQKEDELEKELQLQLISRELQMYKEKRSYYESLKKREHEFKNQLIAMQSMLHMKKYSEVETMLSDLCQNHYNKTQYFDTNNSVVNIILNTKYQEACSKGIVMIVEFNDLSCVGISESEIASVLGNLLLNAIEASEKCESQKRICVKLLYNSCGFVISVKNHYAHNIIKQGDIFVTNKPPKEFHGYGLRTVKNIVDGNDATMVIDYDENEFLVTICFFKG